MSLIQIRNDITVPKYKQIVKSIEDGISSGVLKKGNLLPSINSIRDDHALSRDTVIAAFNELKVRGIVEAVPGKGNYIKSEDLQVKEKLFLLFDELNAFKEDLYNALIRSLGSNFQVDLFFHQFDANEFKRLIADNAGAYNYYVIMPANLSNVKEVLDTLPENQVFLLDQTRKELKGFPAVYQNFEKDIHASLVASLPQLKKYERLLLLFPEGKQPLGMLKGFENFQKSSTIPCDVISDLTNWTIKKGEAYLILEDRLLMELLKKANDKQWVIGKDIGVISYNDSLLKEVLANGITTISTDFTVMGDRLAQMIIAKERLQIENENRLIIRNSL